jgi:hypothetical protein
MILAECVYDGIIEIEPGNIYYPSRTTTIDADIYTCPKCGRPSRVFKGKFDFTRDGFPIFISGPEESQKAYDKWRSKQP